MQKNRVEWIKQLSIAVISTLVFSSAIGVVYCKHQSRQLFTKLQNLQQDIESLQVEWSQLLLEQGTWAADARVEHVARERLQMHLPEPREVVVIKE
ncbi:cell division protein FtsL [Candidatus Berkiella aquae]|uniref:Cell division protein FtsL n=1 Tax=Candidatus Berkiella aquae TaxID=295108 RepID=A0A0Q9YGN0_9GAMM|nr:cell division protein FtsL [Candidatus Berkiella aquae]MCS5710800.1 cell division protein FtsL [Candidatus Berkiella aquae]